MVGGVKIFIPPFINSIYMENTMDIEVCNIKDLDPKGDHSKIAYVAGNHSYWVNVWFAIKTMVNRSVLANPFKDQPNWASLYKRWLWDKIRNRRGAQYAAVLEIASGKYAALACWCKPVPRHCDIIIDSVKWVASDEDAVTKFDPSKADVVSEL